MLLEIYLIIQAIVVVAIFFGCCYWLLNAGLKLPENVESLRVELFDGKGFQKWKTIVFPMYIVLMVLSFIFNMLLGAVIVGSAYSAAKDVRDWWHEHEK